MTNRATMRGHLFTAAHQQPAARIVRPSGPMTCRNSAYGYRVLARCVAVNNSFLLGRRARELARERISKYLPSTHTHTPGAITIIIIGDFA